EGNIPCSASAKRDILFGTLRLSPTPFKHRHCQPPPSDCEKNFELPSRFLQAFLLPLGRISLQTLVHFRGESTSGQLLDRFHDHRNRQFLVIGGKAEGFLSRPDRLSDLLLI